MLKIEAQVRRYQLTARAHASLMRDINRRCMERQLAERVPKHFEMGAYAEYGARPRQSKYNEYKMKKKYVGHIRPNVLTGRMKRSLRGKITATQYGSKLRMSVRQSPRIDKDEWDKLTPAQQAKRKRQSRMADWQKREIAVMSRNEIAQERKRQASEYKRGATGKYKRIRSKRIK